MAGVDEPGYICTLQIPKNTTPQREKGEAEVEEGLRGPLIVAEVAALGAILALVEDTVARVALGLMVGLLLARSALTPIARGKAEGPPEGLDDRRHDHLFRHWVNTLIKKIREFHAVCQGMRERSVNVSVAQLRVREIEKDLHSLMDQVADSAKPEPLRQAARRRGAPGGFGKKTESYGEDAKNEFDYD